MPINEYLCMCAYLTMQRVWKTRTCQIQMYANQLLNFDTNLSTSFVINENSYFYKLTETFL